jgi:hypothetical protein
MDMSESKKPLGDISPHERRTMLALLRMNPEQHKTAVKVGSPKGDAQPQRRAQERQDVPSAVIEPSR